MSFSCAHLVASLKECLLRSDCVVKQGLLPSECIKEHYDELPIECQAFRQAVFECKRSQLDMRKRFRGVKGHAKPAAELLVRQDDPPN